MAARGAGRGLPPLGGRAQGERGQHGAAPGPAPPAPPRDPRRWHRNPRGGRPAPHPRGAAAGESGAAPPRVPGWGGRCPGLVAAPQAQLPRPGGRELPAGDPPCCPTQGQLRPEKRLLLPLPPAPPPAAERKGRREPALRRAGARRRLPRAGAVTCAAGLAHSRPAAA